jgi:hypothetical protein
MNTTRELEQRDSGILVATLTPEETARRNELKTRYEQIEVALWNAKRMAKQARREVNFLKKHRKCILAKLRPLQKVRFPELPDKQSLL